MQILDIPYLDGASYISEHSRLASLTKIPGCEPHRQHEPPSETTPKFVWQNHITDCLNDGDDNSIKKKKIKKK